MESPRRQAHARGLGGDLHVGQEEAAAGHLGGGNFIAAVASPVSVMNAVCLPSL